MAKKAVAAAKKVPAKKAAPTPAKKAVATAKKTEASKEEAEGKYAWLANRFKAAIVEKLPEDVRSQARKEFKDIPDFIGAVNHAGEKYGFTTDPVGIIQFVDEVIAAGVTKSSRAAE